MVDSNPTLPAKWSGLRLLFLLAVLGSWGLGSCAASSEPSEGADTSGNPLTATGDWDDVEPLTWPVARELIYGKALADQRGSGPAPRLEGLEHVAAVVREHPRCAEAHEVYQDLWFHALDQFGRVQAEYGYLSAQHPDDPLLRLLWIRAAAMNRPFPGDRNAAVAEVEAMMKQGAPLGLSLPVLAHVRSLDTELGGINDERDRLEEQWVVETDPWYEVARGVWDKDEARAIEGVSAALRSSPWLWDNPSFFSGARGHGADRTPLEQHIIDELDALQPQHADDLLWLSRAAEWRAALGDDAGLENLVQRLAELDPAWQPMVAERWREERLVFRGMGPEVSKAMYERTPTEETLTTLDEALEQYLGTPLELELAEARVRQARRLDPPQPDLVLQSYDRLDALGGLGWSDQVRRVELLLATGEDDARALEVLDRMEQELTASPVTRTTSFAVSDDRPHPVGESLSHRRGMTAVVLQLRGLALHRLGRSEEGAAALRRAVLLDELHPLAWSRLATVERALGNEQAAVEAGVRALVLNSSAAAADREWIAQGVARQQPGWDDLDLFLEAERKAAGLPGWSKSRQRGRYWDLGETTPDGATPDFQRTPASICGSPLPPFSLSLAAGGELTAEDFPGQVTVLVSWDAMYTRRNADGTSRYRKLQDEITSVVGSDQVRVVALSTGSQRERVRRIVREDEITIDVALSADLLVDALLLHYPGSAAVVDREGLIRFAGYTAPYPGQPEEDHPFRVAIRAALDP